MVLLAAAALPGCGGGSEDEAIAEEGVEGRVRSVIAKQREMSAKDVAVDALVMGEEIGADEFDLVEILLALEEIYSIEIPDERLKGPARRTRIPIRTPFASLTW